MRLSADTILLLMGESGSGKTTIADILEECHGLTQIKSYTTRPRRFSTENSHTFVNEDQFNKLQHLVSYTFFNGYHYGATADQVQNNSVFVVDPYGVKYFKENYSGNKNPIVVYIYVPAEERFKRMTERGDTEYNAQVRLKHDIKAFSDALDLADYVVENEHISKSVHAILEIIGWNDS